MQKLSTLFAIGAALAATPPPFNQPRSRPVHYRRAHAEAVAIKRRRKANKVARIARRINRK